MIKEKLLITFIIFVSTTLGAMEAPPQKSAEYSTDIFKNLPTDVQGYLLQFVPHGKQIETEKAIFTLASTCKQLNKLINTPHVMLGVLNAVAEKSPYLAHAVALAERLHTKEKTVPVMKSPAVTAWIANAKASLENGFELYRLVMFSAAPIEEDIKQLKNYFKNRKIDINYKRASMTPLLIASNIGYAKIIEFLLEHGADARVQDADGYTTLMHLSSQTKPETIVSLIKAGANPNIPSHSGYTPLVKAIEVRNIEDHVIRVLLDHGADPEFEIPIGARRIRIYDWAYRRAPCSEAILDMLHEAIVKKKEKLALKQAGKQ